MHLVIQSVLLSSSLSLSRCSLYTTYLLSFFSLLFSLCFPVMPPDMKCNDVVPWVLNSILSKSVVSANPHVRQAACIWLLSLVKRLSQHKEIKVGLHRYSQIQIQVSHTHRSVSIKKI